MASDSREPVPEIQWPASPIVARAHRAAMRPCRRAQPSVPAVRCKLPLAGNLPAGAKVGGYSPRSRSGVLSPQRWPPMRCPVSIDEANCRYPPNGKRTAEIMSLRTPKLILKTINRCSRNRRSGERKYGASSGSLRHWRPRSDLTPFLGFFSDECSKSVGDLPIGTPPRSASRALMVGSARAALISSFSLSMISVAGYWVHRPPANRWPRSPARIRLRLGYPVALPRAPWWSPPARATCQP